MTTKKNDDGFLFSLDIGTRSVVGILSEKTDEGYTIYDYEMVPHPDRAMLDGQIHDIDKVTKVVQKVKASLEERSGERLTEVAIAAAGRALKTQTVSVEQELDSTREIEKSLMDTLEMEGVQRAQAQLQDVENLGDIRYHCVGYSVTNHYLDGSMIINPKGHRGRKLRAEIIATFLPHIVVDSLYTVMARCGLDVVSLTLEPIAAINLAIPPKLRLLNLALVDVGAGTSDIAITKEGTILSYGMVDMAGDEITEALVRSFLMDFDSAEALKIKLMDEDTLKFTDIVGMSYEKTKEEILSIIKPTLKTIAEAIAKKITEVNERPPSAVFCIGGGCQIPLFVNVLAEAVGLPAERVVIKGTEALEHLSFQSKPLKGPEFVTPLGIGYTAGQEKSRDFVQVSVNEVPVRLLNAKKLKVSDALILVGFHARKLIAERGEAFSISVNGQKRRISGAYGEPAKIWINGVPASLDSELKNKDMIVIEPATSGKKRSIRLKEFLNIQGTIKVNNKTIDLSYRIKVNGQIENGDYLLKPNDEVDIQTLRTAADLMSFLDLSESVGSLYVGNKKLKKTDVLKHGEKIELRKRAEESVKNKKQSNEKEKSSIKKEEPEKKAKVKTDKDKNEALVAEEKIEPKTKKIEKSTQPNPFMTYNYQLSVNGAPVLVEGVDHPMMFVDIFDYIDFDMRQAKGILDLKLNGKRAAYTDRIKTGDAIEIGWKKR